MIATPRFVMRDGKFLTRNGRFVLAPATGTPDPACCDCNYVPSIETFEGCTCCRNNITPRRFLVTLSGFHGTVSSGDSCLTYCDQLNRSFLVEAKVLTLGGEACFHWWGERITIPCDISSSGFVSWLPRFSICAIRPFGSNTEPERYYVLELDCGLVGCYIWGQQEIDPPTMGNIDCLNLDITLSMGGSSLFCNGGQARIQAAP
jgi:hypothetical protein